MIGDQVEIQILEISATQVKLGIEAPREITVLRKEIHLTSQQNQAAARQMDQQGMAKLLGSLKGPQKK
jgi:carbon storage regulator